MNKTKKAGFWRTADDKTSECGLCPHFCKIPPGKSGICGARHNRDGELTAESYGKVTSIALDPIEKKPLYHFFPGGKILSIGGCGCNLRCGFCQNHGISMKKPSDPSLGYREFTPGEIAALSKKYAGQGNLGVAYTYNEPVVGYEFVEECAHLVKNQGQKNVLVTNGYVNREPWERIFPKIDAANIDLKSFNPAFYREIGGSLEDVLRSIEIAAKRCHVEVTTLVIPQKNDSAEEMHSLSKWLAGIDPDIVLHITRFFPAYKMLGAEPTPVEAIYRLVETAKNNLKYVYSGNC